MKDKIKKLIEIMDYYDLAEDERRLELRIYKVRWIWYHTVLAVGLGFVIWLLYEINSKLEFLI